MNDLPPGPRGPQALRTLSAMLRARSLLPGLAQLHHELGDVYQIPMPGFRPVVLVGPEAARFVYVTDRDQLRWRAEGDPVTRLLRHGLLVEDGETHAALRRQMNPSLHKRMLGHYSETILRHTEQMADGWESGSTVDMLSEMRRLTLLILVEALFGADLAPELDRLWGSILRILRYIAPGPWLLWRDIPRLGYARSRRRLDGYLFRIIEERRASGAVGSDLVGLLIQAGLDDQLIRDQILTMLIAGHDTSTALLTWTLHLLGTHPEILAQLQAEVAGVLDGQPPDLEAVAQLPAIDRALNEGLRLYPPIHLSSRTAATDLEFGGYRIPSGTRVLLSIYLTHRHPEFWPEPERFDPHRFESGTEERQPYTFIPFGGGARNCIGMAFARVEAQLILARLLQRFEIDHLGHPVHPYMGATLEPHPGVRMQVTRRGS